MKCQDATGRWHYGDTAAEECAKSKIIEMSAKTGAKKRVIAAPPTEAELKAREHDKALKVEAEEQAKQDAILLATYAHENDILYIRDRKLAQVDASIKASEQTLAPLRAALKRMEAQASDEQGNGDKVSEQTAEHIAKTKAQIARHEAAIAAKEQEKEQIRAKYAADLERFREIKQKQVAPAQTGK